ncbi:MAG: hypothetical protein KDG55_22160 [Rhodocyclaceae bacterium]|nr:hypothetical protein [Rhodocyclaceae bacterium]
MLILRLLGILCLIGAAASVAAFLLTGNRRYLSVVGWILRFAAAMVIVFVALLLLERVLAPMV